MDNREKQIDIPQIIKAILTIIVIIVPALIFGLMGKTVEMGLIIVASSIAVTFLNIDKVQHFKGAGFEAEMKKAVEEAHATIDNLKEMSIPLILSTLNEILYSGRIGGLGKEKTHKLKDDIEELIGKFGIQDEKINSTLDEFYRHNTWDFFQDFVYTFVKGKSNLNDLNVKLNSICDRKTKNYPSKEEILEIIDINEKELDEIENKKLKDYLYYKENHKLP